MVFLLSDLYCLMQIAGLDTASKALSILLIFQNLAYDIFYAEPIPALNDLNCPSKMRVFNLNTIHVCVYAIFQSSTENMG